jgi:Phosphodiester glycosidase
MHRAGPSRVEPSLGRADAGWPEPTRRPARRGGRLRRLLGWPGTKVVLVLLGVFLCWFSWSMSESLTAPGTDSVSSRIAEWARDHYLGPLVTLAESISYRPPKVGGKPSFALTGPASPGASRRKHAHRNSIRPIVPPRLASLVAAPLPGEGAWRVLGSVRGVPAIYGTFMRPDNVHTSYVAAIASLDPSLLRFQLHPGIQDPGPANWGVPPTIGLRSRGRLLATFNGGFKINASGGGFYLNGITSGTMQNGAASLVFYRDGRVTVGVWGRGLHMAKDIAGVRQNLRPIVDHGIVPATVDKNIESSWGATLGGGYYVWRSGVGVTRDGRIIYVYGPALTVRTLANLLRRAGCVEAMQLDINPEWMSFMYYHPQPGRAAPAPANLLPTQQQPADRYYSVSSRDFTAVYAR